MQTASIMLNLGSALPAFAAAAFWFLSARNKLPPMVSYYDRAPDNDPFFVAVQAGVKLNRQAAYFAALSALCAGLGTLASSVQ